MALLTDPASGDSLDNDSGTQTNEHAQHENHFCCYGSMARHRYGLHTASSQGYCCNHPREPHETSRRSAIRPLPPSSQQTSQLIDELGSVLNLGACQ